mmetsp:Transcript_22131/g.46694  ORF Transcript_22131/g.46694 Transcript_22131/m.46694 type:complete len:137 (-) Transcript_22131:1428-1838(-)
MALREIQMNVQVHPYLHHPPKSPHATQDMKMKDGTPIQKIYLGAYANRLTPVDTDWTLESSDETQAMRDDLSPKKYYDHVKLWYSNDEHTRNDALVTARNGAKLHYHENIVGGVQLIGGCCAIGPSHIAVLKDKLG